MARFKAGDTAYLTYPSDLDAFPVKVLYVRNDVQYVVESAIHGNMMIAWDDDLYSSKLLALRDLYNDWQESVNDKVQRLHVLKSKLRECRIEPENKQE